MNDLKKSIFNHAFLLSMTVTCVLCFTSVIYMDQTGKEYSVFEVIRKKSQFAGMNFNVVSVLKSSISTYLTLFLPILSALPYVSFFCAERMTGCGRFHISRSGKLPYYTAKFIAADVSGGLSIMLGYALYGILISIFFPLEAGSLVGVPKLLLGVMLYGMVSVIPAFFLSSFVKNKYITCCLPFIFMNFYCTVISRLQNYFILRNNMEAFTKLPLLYPDSVRSFSSESYIYGALYHAGLSVLALVGFVCIMNRRLDYGE